MDTDAETLYKYNAQVHQWNYNQLVALEERIAQCTDLQELADYGYALKKVADLVDDTRKVASRISEVAQRLQCGIQTAMHNIGPVRTAYCTATPDVKFQTSIPKRESDPEGYYAIMDLCGIPREVSDVEAVRAHWPGVTELLTQRMREGKPLPEGLNPDNVKPVYKVTYRKKTDAPF